MRKYGIAKKVLVIFLLVTIGIVLLTIVSVVTGGNYLLRTTSIDYTNHLVSQVDNTVINYQKSMENIANSILNESAIEDFILKGANNKEAGIQSLNFAASTRHDITNIFAIRINDNEFEIICNDRSKKINQHSQYEESARYKALILQGKESVITSSYVQNLVENQYNWVISLGVAIKDVNEKTVGIILIDLNYTSVKNICDNVMPENQGYIYLLSESGEIVYHPTQQLIFNNVKKEDVSIVQNISNDLVRKDGVIYIVLSSNENTWKTVAVLDESAVYRNTKINTIIFAVIGLLIILLSIFISYKFSNWFTKPLRELSHNMKEVQNGNLMVRVNINNKDEIGDLGESFNIMTERLDQSLKRVLVEQEDKRNSELNALRAQINPHFLYNTLDSIIWMAECNQTDDVVDMTSALSKMLRASISRQEGGATLKLELQNAENYLKIQKLRYSNKLDYEINVTAGLFNKKAVHLVLQPLVENAIYHGIREKKAGGKIIIKAFEENGLLIIQVIDDGAGMSTETLNGLLKNENSDKGIGIYNVDRRIKLLFGEDYGLSIKSELSKGTTVTITIPSEDAFEEGDDLYENQH